MGSKGNPSYEYMANNKAIADLALHQFMDRDPPEDPIPSGEEEIPDVTDQITGMEIAGEDSRNSTQIGSTADLVVFTPASGNRARSSSRQSHMSGESDIRTSTGKTSKTRSMVKPGYSGTQFHERPPDKYMRSCHRGSQEENPPVPGVSTQTGPSYSSRCYTPSRGVINYLDTIEGAPPFELSSELRDWHNDCWGGLINPPANLRIEHFIRSLPEECSQMGKLSEGYASIHLCSTEPKGCT